MKADQVIRAVAIVAFLAGYVARLHYVGNGEIYFLSYQFAPFSFLGAVLILLALPETIDMLPFGPSRDRRENEN